MDFKLPSLSSQENKLKSITCHSKPVKARHFNRSVDKSIIDLAQNLQDKLSRYEGVTIASNLTNPCLEGIVKS